MIWTVALLLLVLWLIAFVFDVLGSIVHVLLAVALVMFLVSVIGGRRRIR